jgi:hypothetical protein
MRPEVRCGLPDESQGSLPLTGADSACTTTSAQVTRGSAGDLGAEAFVIKDDKESSR